MDAAMNKTETELPKVLPLRFTDAAAIQIGPRSWRLAIETWVQVHHEQHGWVTIHQYAIDNDRKFRTGQAALDAADMMRAADARSKGRTYVRPVGEQDHTIVVKINSRRQETYYCSNAEQPYIKIA